jgi:hypothetical protein
MLAFIFHFSESIYITNFHFSFNNDLSTLNHASSSISLVAVSIGNSQYSVVQNGIDI